MVGSRRRRSYRVIKVEMMRARLPEVVRPRLGNARYGTRRSARPSLQAPAAATVEQTPAAKTRSPAVRSRDTSMVPPADISPMPMALMPITLTLTAL
jgi:hypothetical protein